MVEIKLSIIVITYNQEEYIESAINSILQQDIGFSYEILIGDDCSTDKTGEIIERIRMQYPDIIKVMYHESNVGASRNLYDLFMIASGEYIIRLEGDNYWEKTDQIAWAIKYLDEHQEFIGVSHKHKTLDEETGEFIRGCKAGNFKNHIATLNDYMKNQGGETGDICYRNFYKEKDADFSIIYRGGRMIAERTIDLLTFERGDVYITDKDWEVCRGGKRKKGASNYQSITKRSDILNEWLRNAEILQEYRPDLDFFEMKATPVLEMMWDNFRIHDYGRTKKLMKRFQLNDRVKLYIRFSRRVVKRGLGKVLGTNK